MRQRARRSLYLDRNRDTYVENKDIGILIYERVCGSRQGAGGALVMTNSS